MVFEASTVVHAQQPVLKKHTSTTQPDPMVFEAASADHAWQPVPKKLISNRQPKSGLGIPVGLVLDKGKDRVISKGKSVEAVGIESVDIGLMALGSIPAATV
ncbi:hypothetical protein OIU84_002776 [Salix udensis]|uniref:Uncharacterized protein n=1 Tax=Salix udensis TaxID=889485 RepID=A0AAD6K6V7_9ROSI|nr:hypothetical protein OIU84_002776 [Salix udensis]